MIVWGYDDFAHEMRRCGESHQAETTGLSKPVVGCVARGEITSLERLFGAVITDPANSGTNVDIVHVPTELGRSAADHIR